MLCCIPLNWQKLSNSSDMNCGPLSVMMAVQADPGLQIFSELLNGSL